MVTLYILIYAAWGLMLGFFISGMPVVLEEIKNEKLKIEKRTETLIKVKKRYKWLSYVLIMGFIAMVFILEGKMNHILYIVLRSLAVTMMLFVIVRPIIVSFINYLGKNKKEDTIPFYLKILDNMCFADYIDRITFQKQIWQFNEMSSLIKTFHCNKMYHDEFLLGPTNTIIKKPKFNPVEVRFTKVLTKYSTEYNNSIFIQNLCQQLGLDKKDTFSFFLELRNNNTKEEEMYEMFEPYEIRKLDIERIYRYLDKYTNRDCNIECIDGEDEDSTFSTF